VECVCDLDPFCCLWEWDEVCTELAEDCGFDCDGPCLPQCYSSDGDKLECGPDGCGSSCGQCAADEECKFGKCVGGCEPDCTIFGFQKECGADGCGSSCGTCPAGTYCDGETFMCLAICVPDCQGKDCGGDGCGSSCGQCSEGTQCVDGVCQIPYTCLDMVECAIACGFSMNCVWSCYGSGDEQSKGIFQEVAWCIIQDCAWNIDEACILGSLEGQCSEPYQECAADN